MRQRTVIRTTLGDLIIAVTDEVVPFVRDSSSLYMVVSRVLDDVLAHHQLRPENRQRRKHRLHVPKARSAMSFNRLIEAAEREENDGKNDDSELAARRGMFRSAGRDVNSTHD